MLQLATYTSFGCHGCGCAMHARHFAGSVKNHICPPGRISQKVHKGTRKMIRHIVPGLALVAGTCIMLSSAAQSSAQSPALVAQQKASSIQRAKSPVQRAKGGESCGEEGCDECGQGRRGCCFRRAANRAANFNCGCNGSYKFPVPPLSTYHWPGMYSHQLMTDYHSPWRFPPLRPYTDEPSYNGNTGRRASHAVRSISHEQPEPTPRRGVESLSAKINRLYGTK
jgi:hypothetical protein